MPMVKRTLLIEAPAEAVFDLVVARLGQHRMHGPVGGNGGPPVIWDARLTETVPGASLEFTLSGPADGCLGVTFAPVFDGCTWVTWTIEFSDATLLPDGQLEAIAGIVWDRAEQFREYVETEGRKGSFPGVAGPVAAHSSRR